MRNIIIAMATTWPSLSAAAVAAGIKHALDADETTMADRYLAEATSQIILAPLGVAIPADVTSESPSIGDRHYDTLLATAFAFALTKKGVVPPSWMLDAPALSEEWMWDGGYDAGEPFKQFIKANTPPMFLAKNILLCERDLIAP